MKKILITGIRSGLGKFIYENIGGFGLSRNNFAKVKNYSYEVIIHCAASTRRDYGGNRLADYVEDNIFLTRSLLDIPHKKFIYFSSIDVYPKEHELFSEDAVIDVDKIDGLYGVTKFISEALVRENGTNYLILRPSAFLGKNSRPNSLIKIIDSEKCCLTISKNSVFNYILHCDVLTFVQYAIKHNLQGIYNLASKNNITFSSVVKIIQDRLGKKAIVYGDYLYDCGRIDISKISKLSGFSLKTSREVVMEFLENHL